MSPRRIPPSRRALLLAPTALLTAAGALSGCGTSFPADSQGTLERAQGGVLRVGISENAPYTTVSAGGTVGGREATLIRRYAEGIRAAVSWRPGGEGALAHAMSADLIDLAIGGLTSDSPHSSHIALTRPYTREVGPDGTERGVVMGVRPGENALMVDLELFLARAAGEI